MSGTELLVALVKRDGELEELRWALADRDARLSQLASPPTHLSQRPQCQR
ncbi:MAG: hypothetical protein ACYDB7_03090 [Mycobacteriales bacterium]